MHHLPRYTTQNDPSVGTYSIHGAYGTYVGCVNSNFMQCVDRFLEIVAGVRRVQHVNSSFEMFSGHLALHHGWLCAVLHTCFTDHWDLAQCHYETLTEHPALKLRSRFKIVSKFDLLSCKMLGKPIIKRKLFS